MCAAGVEKGDSCHSSARTKQEKAGGEGEEGFEGERGRGSERVALSEEESQCKEEPGKRRRRGKGLPIPVWRPLLPRIYYCYSATVRSRVLCMPNHYHGRLPDLQCLRSMCGKHHYHYHHRYHYHYHHRDYLLRNFPRQLTWHKKKSRIPHRTGRGTVYCTTTSLCFQPSREELLAPSPVLSPPAR
jgi:hypothetical protein